MIWTLFSINYVLHQCYVNPTSPFNKWDCLLKRARGIALLWHSLNPIQESDFWLLLGNYFLILSYCKYLKQLSLSLSLMAPEELCNALLQVLAKCYWLYIISPDTSCCNAPTISFSYYTKNYLLIGQRKPSSIYWTN